MNTKIYLLISLFIIACSVSGPDENELSAGQAIIKIENETFQATPVMSRQIIAELQYKKISMALNDSVQVIILKQNFSDETIIWTIDDHVSREIMFSLQYNFFGGSVYIPVQGYLTIHHKESTISADFEITLTGGPYSCIACPEALKHMAGSFIVND